MKSTMTRTSNDDPCSYMASDDSTRDDSIHLLPDADSILSLSDNDSVPALCTWFKTKPEIDIVMSYSTVQIQEAEDSLSNILFKEMINS